ncbi:hypothetical protein L7F22_050355 [Adiantum nelumboides]|nr:hypothetical protein [Adiantum nelumboides]
MYVWSHFWLDLAVTRPFLRLGPEELFLRPWLVESVEPLEGDVQPPGVHRRIVFQGSVPVSQHPDLYWQPIRIVGSLGKRCTVDPMVSIEEAMFWRLWIWEGSPLSQIVWDLGEWFWPSQQRLGEEVSFFEYSVPMGRDIMRRFHPVPHYPRRLQHWLTQGLSHTFMRHFWTCTWTLTTSRRISFFMWMLAHGGLPFGTWPACMGHDPICVRCTLQHDESLRHCFWICPDSHFVWRAVCCLLIRVGVHQGFVTWGAVTWLQQLSGLHLLYECLSSDPVFLLTALGYRRGTLDMIPASVHDIDSFTRDIRFVIICSISLWMIRKVRCSSVLSAQPSSVLNTLVQICSALIHTLRSQWYSSAGSSRATEERRRSFLRRWVRTPILFRMTQGRITWHYSPPKWIYFALIPLSSMMYI